MTISYTPYPVTEPQLAFIRALQKRLHLTDPALDLHTTNRFGVTTIGLSKQQASLLIEEMQTWKAVPADLMRAQGQMDLF